MSVDLGELIAAEPDLMPLFAVMNPASPRAADWAEHFGCDHVEIDGGAYYEARRRDGSGEPFTVAVVRVATIGGEHRERIIATVMATFGLDRVEVESALNRAGALPFPINDVILCPCVGCARKMFAAMARPEGD